LSAPRKVADSMEKNTLMSRGQRAGKRKPAKQLSCTTRDG
jgi:hypothetical protein